MNPFLQIINSGDSVAICALADLTFNSRESKTDGSIVYLHPEGAKFPSILGVDELRGLFTLTDDFQKIARKSVIFRQIKKPRDQNDDFSQKLLAFETLYGSGLLSIYPFIKTMSVILGSTVELDEYLESGPKVEDMFPAHEIAVHISNFQSFLNDHLHCSCP